MVGGGGLFEDAHPALIARVDIRAFFDEEAGGFSCAIVGGGDQQRGATEFGAGIDLRAFRQEQPDLGGVAGAPHEGSSAKVVGGVWVGAGVEQEAHAFETAEGGGIHQGRVAAAVAGLGTGVANELAKSGEIVISDGEIERAAFGGVAEKGKRHSEASDSRIHRTSRSP